MKSEWRVTYRQDGMSLMYCAYRLKNISIVDNPGNREYDSNWFLRRPTAEQRAAELNAKERRLEGRSA